MNEVKTIVGIATGTPDGGVAIIRLSGPQAQAIAKSRVSSLPPPRLLARRKIHINSKDDSSQVEDGLIVFMPGPASFTGEDIVELHVHGGVRNVQSILDSLLAAGACLAGPGEFTRRAFEQGRLSLDQAEGIAALIASHTEAGLQQARRLASGELGQKVSALCEDIANLRAEIEANLDFPEDVESLDVARWSEEMNIFREILEQWLQRFEAGKRARQLARIVLAGPANAGKSALFNALLGRARALVSPHPGTTRDYVEADFSVGEFGAVLVDTAGLREATSDQIESAGIAYSYDQTASADIVIWVEAADSFEQVDRPTKIHGHTIFVESKCDLSRQRNNWLGVSVVTNQGIEQLREAIRQWFLAGQEQPWIGLLRHRERVFEAKIALEEALQLLTTSDIVLEIVAFQLATAIQRLAEIRGQGQLGPIGADVLERIFSQFCIGK